MGRLEKLDRIAVRVLQQDLLAARSGLHLIAKTKSRRFQMLDPRGEIGDFKNDPIPPAELLAMPAGVGREPDAPGPLRISLGSPVET